MSDKNATNKMTTRSGLLTDGLERAAAGGMLSAGGRKADEFKKGQKGNETSGKEKK